MFFFYCFCAHRDLHSFPTRRSSDLIGPKAIVVLFSADPRVYTNDVDYPFRQENNLFFLTNLNQKRDRKSTRLNSSHVAISYAVFCLKKKKKSKQHSPSYET